MANEEQLALLKAGVKVWNQWMANNAFVEIDLQGADLRGADLVRAELYRANLNRSHLSGANLSEASLWEANLSEANLSNADLSGAKLWEADFRKANLSKASVSGAYLGEANLSEANLTGAYLCDAKLNKAILKKANLSEADVSGADLRDADLSEADLRLANLNNSNLVRVNVNNARLSKSSVYSVNVWDLVGEFKEQKDLIITPKDHLPITVDNIKVAQFIYLILNNKEIRDVIDTVTTKAVLVLGRFYEERKQVLDALKDALRERGFIPIIFDFEPSKQRDLTETIQLLANMAKFVIADITDAKSIPQELSHIIPLLPSVPVQPILLASEKEYAMFEHWRSFKTVLPEFLYRDKQDLLDNLEDKILQPIDSWREGHDEVGILQNRITELEAKLRNSKQI
jgi:uncharacterized protein YjbI with pentapeptide repeats